MFGFPLKTVLSSGGNLTEGVVSAVTGLGNSTGHFQLTAPIQGGSSGSPVLNGKGEIVGVVNMRLSDAKLLDATGSVGQNVNFAISGATLQAFLSANGVEFETGSWFDREKSPTDLAELAREWTFPVECWK